MLTFVMPFAAFGAKKATKHASNACGPVLVNLPEPPLSGIAPSHSIQKSIHELAASSPLTWPNSLAVDTTGNVYVGYRLTGSNSVVDSRLCDGWSSERDCWSAERGS